MFMGVEGDLPVLKSTKYCAAREEEAEVSRETLAMLDLLVLILNGLSF